MRKRFDKSPAIDAASNLRLVTMIQNHDEPYTEKEEELLRTGVGRFRLFDAQVAKELKMDSASTKAKIALEKGDGHAWGWAKTTVRASPTEVRARAGRAQKNAACERSGERTRRRPAHGPLSTMLC